MFYHVSKINKIKIFDLYKLKIFNQIQLTHDMVLHPRYFGPEIRKTIKDKLYREIEGTCLGQYGYVITITCIDDIGTGVLFCESGMAHYEIRYKAIVFRPFKGEVLEAIVKQVNKIGIFAEIGGVTCFINRHSIPSHYQYQGGIPACYKSEGDEPAIFVEENIRVKIIGVRMDMSGLFTVGELMFEEKKNLNKEFFFSGTLMDDYLGVIET